MEYNSIQLLKSLTLSTTKQVNKFKDIPFIETLIQILDKANKISDKVFLSVKNPSITKFTSFPIIRPPITEVISNVIIKYIYSKLKYIIEYNIQFLDIQSFTIRFYVTSKPTKRELMEYNQRIYVLINTLSFFILFLQYKNSKKIKFHHQNIFFFMTSLKKELPNHKSELEQYHVNTGYTAPHKGNSDIVIYRKEEWYKVFIHEYVHNHHLDFSHLNSSFMKLSKKIYNINNDILFSEAMAEIWALSVNILMISYLFKKYNMFPELHKIIPSNHLRMGVSHIFQYLLNIEIYFSIIQTKKILKYLNTNYSQLFDKSKSIKIHNENTNICSYYFIKTIYIYFYLELDYLMTLSNKKVDIKSFERMANHPHIIYLLNEKIPTGIIHSNTLRMCALEIH
jgi:hypothetical protein